MRQNHKQYIYNIGSGFKRDYRLPTSHVFISLVIMQATMSVSHNKGVNWLSLTFHPKLAFLLLSLESTKLMNRCYFR